MIDKFIYKRTDIITCVSKPMKDYIYKETKHENIHVLYNGISPESIKNELESIANREKNKIKIGYAGNIDIVQNMNIILKASQLLTNNKDYEDIEFANIGEGIERKKLEERIAELNIKNITFTGTLSKNEVLNALNKVDLLFFSLIEDPVFEKTIPSKLIDYLLNNKPIITSI